jgi:hypothetical protein
MVASVECSCCGRLESAHYGLVREWSFGSGRLSPSRCPQRRQAGTAHPACITVLVARRLHGRPSASVHWQGPAGSSPGAALGVVRGMRVASITGLPGGQRSPELRQRIAALSDPLRRRAGREGLVRRGHGAQARKAEAPTAASRHSAARNRPAAVRASSMPTSSTRSQLARVVRSLDLFGRGGPAGLILGCSTAVGPSCDLDRHYVPTGWGGDAWSPRRTPLGTTKA